MTEATQITRIKANDAIEGPLSSVIHRCLGELSKLSGGDAGEDVEELKRRLTNDFIRSYCDCSASDRRSVDKQLVDVLYLLTTTGLDFSAICDANTRQTALHIIAGVPDSCRFIRALHAAGAKVNAKDWHLQTPLHLTAKNADTGNSQALLDCGANPNERDCNGQSPLHLTATGRRHLGVMQLLIKSRADTSIADAARRTPLHLACKAGRVPQVRELVVYGKVRLNQKDATGQTALHLAALHDVTGNVLRELLRNKLNVEINAVDAVAMETPLHKALRHNMLENAHLLIHAGSDVNIACVTGETSMHCAAKSVTDLSVWNALMEARGDVTARTASGWTVRRVAEEAKNSAAKSVLAQFGNTDGGDGSWVLSGLKWT